MQLNVAVTNVEWDTDGQDADLPTTTTVSIEDDEGLFPGMSPGTTIHREDVMNLDGDARLALEEMVSDALSDDHGWCHNGFDFAVAPAPSLRP